MKCTVISFAAALLVIASACKSKKSVATSASPAATSTTTSTVAATPDVAPGPVIAPSRPPSGIYEPGSDELAAIRETYSDVEMRTLSMGYAIYIGDCTNCHKAQGIHNYTEERWKAIIDRMAPKSKLNDMQKDAVYKYVLAIKAVAKSNK